MHIEKLRSYCLNKSDVQEEMPFGPDTLVFKVWGKIFMLVGLDQVDQLAFNVKCTPAYAIELRAHYAQTVFPGYHMNKKHWNTVYVGRELDDAALYDLVDHSYQLVVQGLPKKIRKNLL